MDLASLAFEVDSSQTLKAAQSLDQLRQTAQAAGQASEELRSQSDYLVTSMSSQGAGAARLSRQLGEITDRFQDLMTKADAARRIFDGSTATFDAWDIAQNKVEALGRAYGTTARGLDAYLQTANQLQMSSTQAAASVQRLTMALENQGSAAANIRSILTNNGVSINDLQTDQVDTLLTRIKAAFQKQPDSQQRTRDLRAVLGTFDPDVIGTFTNTQYVPIDQKRDMQIRSATDLDIARHSSAVLEDRQRLAVNDTEYKDLMGSVGGGGALRYGTGMFNWGWQGRGLPFGATTEDIAALREAADPDSAFARDGLNSQSGRQALLKQAQGMTITQDMLDHPEKMSAAERAASRIQARPPQFLPVSVTNWMDYLNSGRVSDNTREIETINEQERQDGVNPLTRWWRGSIRADQNLLGIYQRTIKPKPDPTALDQDGTGIELSALGDSRIQRWQSARGVERSLGVQGTETGGDTYEAAKGRRTAALATFTAAYGEKDGRQNFNAARARAVDTERRAWLDDGEVQEANLAVGLSTMSEADAAQAKGFIAFARKRGVPVADMAGQSLAELMNPATSAGGNLPANLLDNYNKQRAGLLKANSNEQDRAFGTEMGDLREQAGIAGTGSANLQDLITYQAAYRKELVQSKDAAAAAQRGNEALAKSEAERVVQIKASIGAMEEQNRQAANYNKAMDAAPSAAGADRSAAAMLASIQQQVDQQRFDKRSAFGPDQEAAFVAAKKDELGNSAVKDANDQAAAAEQELKTQQRLLGVAGDRAGVQSKMSRDIQVEMSFQKDLAQAQASGDQKRIDQVTDLIEHTKRLKDAIAEVNLEAKAFKLGADSRTNIQEITERMKLRPDQRADFDFQAPVRRLQYDSQNLSAPVVGTTVAAGDMSPTKRAFLNTVAGPESGGRYDVRYTPGGGATFGDLSQHPNVREATGNGDFSTAAGRYQVTNSTYREQQAKHGYTDFQPATQDRVGWDLASDRYSAKTKGGDLEADLQDATKRPGVVAALKSTWPTLNADTFSATFDRNLHAEPGSTSMPNQAQNGTAIADAANARQAERAAQKRASVQEVEEGADRAKRASDAQMPFVRRGDQVGARMAELGQVNDADPRGLPAAEADARAKQAAQERDYARQLAATKAATDQTIESNKLLATAYGTSTEAVQRLQDKLKVEAESRTTKMSDLDKENRLIQLNAQRMSEQTAATEQQAKAMRESTADQDAMNKLGPFATERDVGRLQAQQDIDRHYRDNPGEGNAAANADYARDRTAQQTVKETTDAINDYKQAWNGAQSAGFSALNDVIMTGGKATNVVAGLVKSLSQIGLNTVEKGVGSFLSSQLGGLFGGGAGAAVEAAGPALGSLYAMGGAFDRGRPIRAFAAGGLIDRPTHFYSAGGETNLAGEMGTEAILPLKRMPNGDLGVSTGSGGGGGGSSVTVHAPITVNGNGGGGSSQVDPQQLASLRMQLQETVRQAVVAAIADEKRAGGSLY